MKGNMKETRELHWIDQAKKLSAAVHLEKYRGYLNAGRRAPIAQPAWAICS